MAGWLGREPLAQQHGPTTTPHMPMPWHAAGVLPRRTHRIAEPPASQHTQRLKTTPAPTPAPQASPSSAPTETSRAAQPMPSCKKAAEKGACTLICAYGTCGSSGSARTAHQPDWLAAALRGQVPSSAWLLVARARAFPARSSATVNECTEEEPAPPALQQDTCHHDYSRAHEHVEESCNAQGGDNADG